MSKRSKQHETIEPSEVGNLSEIMPELASGPSEGEGVAEVPEAANETPQPTEPAAPEGDQAETQADASEAPAIEAGDEAALNEVLEIDEETDDPVNDPPLAEEVVTDEFDYGCVSKEGKYEAVIYRNGYPCAWKEAPSKYDAMLLRDEAKAAGATSFKD